jgi:hypothetical protein
MHAQGAIISPHSVRSQPLLSPASAGGEALLPSPLLLQPPQPHPAHATPLVGWGGGWKFCAVLWGLIVRLMGRTAPRLPHAPAVPEAKAACSPSRLQFVAHLYPHLYPAAFAASLRAICPRPMRPCATACPGSLEFAVYSKVHDNPHKPPVSSFQPQQLWVRTAGAVLPSGRWPGGGATRRGAALLRRPHGRQHPPSLIRGPGGGAFS